MTEEDDKARQVLAAREAWLDAAQKQYGRIGTVEFSGNTIVFRKPTRLEVRDYRRMLDTPAERPDALDSLAQKTILAFNDLTEPNAARVVFTGSFLESYPLAMGNDKFKALLGVLSGLVEDEDAADLGKGVTVRPAPLKPSPKA